MNLLDQILSFFFYDFSHIFFFLHIFSSLIFTFCDSLCVNSARLWCPVIQSNSVQVLLWRYFVAVVPIYHLSTLSEDYP